MAPRIQTYGPAQKRKITAKLPSGRTVTIDRTGNDEVVIQVSQGSVTRSTTLPVKSFPLFGRPLVQRIREAVILLDRCPPDEGAPDEVERAAEQALFHGGIIEETAHSTRREPPLVSPPLPPPPPAPARRKA